MRLLIVGCGYVGTRVAQVYRDAWPDSHIYALTRNQARCQQLRSERIEPLVGNWLEPESLAGLPQVDHVLIAIPHREVADLGNESHVVGLQNFANAMAGNVGHWVYLSTTGVFGECNGLTVDETTPVSPTRPGPRIAVAAEQWLLETPLDVSPTILRLAGIYGPERLPMVAKVRAGEPLAVPIDGHLNLVHLEDIARVIVEMFTRRLRHRLYLLADQHPVRRETFYRELARQSGLSEPHFVAPETDDSMTRRATDKRVDASRIVGELGYRFRFPDYRAGLRHSLHRFT